MPNFIHFLQMGGYAFYVWTSYACALSLLTCQWVIPWRRWKAYIATLESNE